MNISAASGSIATKFNLKHHRGSGMAKLGFGLDRISALVSMATDRSNKMGLVATLAPLFLIGSS